MIFLVGFILFSQVFIVFLLAREEYQQKFLVSLVMALLIIVPTIIRGLGLRLLATFFMGIILLFVGILTNKKSYIYLGSLYALLIVISSSYLVYITPEA